MDKDKWTLIVSSGQNSETYSFTKDGVYTIGRKGTDIVIAGDKAISRLHAELKLDKTKGHSTFSLEDKSKTGTVVNEERRTKVQGPILLKDGDILKLGSTSTQIKIKYEPNSSPNVGPSKKVSEIVSVSAPSDKKPFYVSFSNLRSKEKRDIQDRLERLGGKAVNKISKANYLIMKKIDVTAKVLLALIHEIPIVSPQWIDAVSNNRGSPLPSTKGYLPPVSDPELSHSLFEPNPSRKTLFSNKSFLFFSEHQRSYTDEIIEAAGGKDCLLFIEPLKNDEKNRKKLMDKIIVEPLVSDKHKYTEEDLAKLKKTLRSMDLKSISQNDIGYAILHVNSDYVQPHVNGKKKDASNSDSGSRSQDESDGSSNDSSS